MTINTLRVQLVLFFLLTNSIHTAQQDHHMVFNIATGPSAHASLHPLSLTQKEITDFYAWKEQQEQSRLKTEELRQQEILGHAQHRTMSLSKPIASAPDISEITAAPQKTHRRQRSLSNPEVTGGIFIPEEPLTPDYAFIDPTKNVDELLTYGNTTLQEALNAFTQLTTTMSQQLHERSEEYRAQSTTTLIQSTPRQPKTNKGKALRFLQKIGINTKKLHAREQEYELEQTIHDTTKQTESAKKALVPLLVSITTVSGCVAKMQEEIKSAAQRTQERQKKLHGRSNSQSSSPKIGRSQVMPQCNFSAGPLSTSYSC